MPPKGPTPAEVAAARSKAYAIISAAAPSTVISGKERANLTLQVRDRLLAGQTEANARAEVLAFVQGRTQAQEQARQQQRQAVLSVPLGAAPTPAGGTAATPPAGTPAAGGQKPMTLSEGFSAHVNALLKTPINPSDYRKPDGSFDTAAYGAAMSDYNLTLTDALESQRQAQQLQIGIIEVPDGNGGTVILDVHDPAVERDPQLAAQMATYFANQDRDLQNKWTMTLHELELDDYAGAVAATNLANSNASRAFQDALGLVHERLALGQADQETAVKEIERQLSGMQESRARASEAETQLSAAAGWASPMGKTAFSAGDLGAGVAGLARFGGLDASAPLLQFSGTRTTDPLGMMAQQDAQLGVTGQLAKIPGLGVSAADLPGAPGYAGAPAGRPQRPNLLPPVIPDRTAAPQLRLTGYNPEEGGM